jgi:hypothetical protein
MSAIEMFQQLGSHSYNAIVRKPSVMAYIITFLTAGGQRVAFSPKKQRSTFHCFQDGLIAESRLGEDDVSYQKYRVKRGYKGVVQSPIMIVRSVQKELDRLRDAPFSQLDEGLVSLARKPTLARSKPKCFKWFVGDLRLATIGDFSVVYTTDDCAKHLRVLMVVIGRWVPNRKSGRFFASTQKNRRETTPLSARDRERRVGVKRTDRFVGYSGETAKELFSYPAQGKHAALVAGFREGIQKKAAQKSDRALTNEERVVLMVSALEEEVNNGGFDQFFRNSSGRFAPQIADSLRRIRCSKMARIAQRAVSAIRVPMLSATRIGATMAKDNAERDKELERCDQLFYEAQKRQNVARRLYSYIRANKKAMKF